MKTYFALGMKIRPLLIIHLTTAPMKFVSTL